MEPEQRRAAKQQMLELMEAGVSWQEAAMTAGIQTSRATAYRWKQEVRTRGEAALQDGRHGHPAKVLPRVLHWLESRCQATSLVASSHLQKELQEQLGVQISISHLNAVRATHGWSNVASQAEKTAERKTSPEELSFQGRQRGSRIFAETNLPPAGLRTRKRGESRA